MKALDLFCGAGGASVGLANAGYEVTGVDIAPQPNYPLRFVQADALTYPLEGYDFIWASPPCQAYSTLNAYNKKSYPDLVAVTRARLEKVGVPYVIENVPQAPLLSSAVLLCGAMFDLPVYRHRKFEASFFIDAPKHPRHEHLCARNGYLPTEARPCMTVTGGRHSAAWVIAARGAMGVHWMRTVHEVCESIPPAYAEFIARCV